MHTVDCRIKRTHGFIPNINLSVHINARRALGNMHPLDYFPQVNKLAFHDLTENNELPKDTNQLLGLGLKYIPIPKFNISKDNTLNNHSHDLNEILDYVSSSQVMTPTRHTTQRH